MLDNFLDTDAFSKYQKIISTLEGDSIFSNIKGTLDYLIDGIFDYYNQVCSEFDDAPDIECLEKTYAVNIPLFRNEASIILTLLDLSCQDNYRARDILQILGRFIFTHFVELHSPSDSIRDFIEKLLKSFLKFIISHSWSFDDTIYVRMGIYNILDIYGSKDLSELREKVKILNVKNTIDLSFGIVVDSIERFSVQNNTITPIKASWLYAYIYKTRFGYLYCRKFAPRNTKAALPYTILTHSLAYRGLCCRIVQNSAKVIAFEIGEMKRSSEYVSKEDSFYYNFSTMKYE